MRIESSFQKVCIWFKDPATKEEQTLQVGTAVPNDETEDKNNVEELKDYMEQPEKIEFSLYSFVTQCDVTAMIADEMKKEMSAIVMQSISNSAEDIIE